MKPDYSFKLTQRVENYILENELIRHGDSVIIGLSGGADSVCLFLLLNSLRKKIDFEMYAIHVNHGIRGESALEDEQFSMKLCEEYNVAFSSYKINVPLLAKEKGLTEEEAGRNARYEIFATAAKSVLDENVRKAAGESFNNYKTSFAGQQVKVAVAHHMDDQAETVLFNMIRGSGLKGIGGMSPFSKRKIAFNDNQCEKISIIRPLLCLTKEEILNYLNINNQDFCIDETNSDNDYSRNQIRNVIIKEFEKIQPKTSEHISYMADDVRLALEYIDEEISNLYDQVVTISTASTYDIPVYNINVDLIKGENPYIVKELIIYVLRRLITTYKDITKKHINDIYSLVNKGKGKRIVLPYNLVAERKKGVISISIMP